MASIGSSVGATSRYCKSLATSERTTVRAALATTDARAPGATPYAPSVELETALRDHGHRVTRPRSVVWEVLATTDGHLSAQEITDRVHAVDAGVNASSIYRTLGLFAEIGLVRESRLGDASTWERAHGDAVIHLVCATCGVVQHHHASSVDSLPRELEQAIGFAAEGIDVRVTGRCASCT
jgi:Fur family ferric uptake transcriptional regulator